MSFAGDVSKWSKTVEANTDETFKNVIFELFSSVILDTPVLEGRARANWVMTLDNPAPSNGRSLSKDPSGARTVGSVTTNIGRIRQGEDFDVYLTNSLPYIYRLEYDGWSDKAKNGMMRKNFVRVTNNLKRKFK